MIVLNPVDGDYIKYQGLKKAAAGLRMPSRKKRRTDMLRGMEEYHYRSFIELNGMYLNPLFTGSNVSILSKYISRKYVNSLKNIVSLSAGINIETGEIVDLSNLDSSIKSFDVLLYGEAIAYIIERTDYNEILMKGISNELKHASSVVVTMESGNAPDTVNKACLFGDVYISSDDPELVKHNLVRIRKKIVEGRMNYTLYLYNLLKYFKFNNSKVVTYLTKVFLMKQAIVVPPTLRPSKEKIDNAITKVYNALREASTKLGPMSSIPERQAVINKIINYLNLIVKDTDNSDVRELSRIKTLRPLYETLKGKQGIIRDKMLSKRQDNSGRAVVTVDPSLPSDTVRIPIHMLEKMLKNRMVSTRGSKQIDTYLANYSALEFSDQLKDCIADWGIAIGRNPTLHKHGLKAFKIEASDGRTIQMPPLLCPAYNMDFDGDQSHANVPVSPLAYRELATLMSVDLNLFYAKTAKCTLLPRMDMIFGIYKATMDYPNQKVNSYTVSTAAELLEKLYKLKIKVWDEVTCPELGSGKAGRLAYLSFYPKKLRAEIESANLDDKKVASTIDFLVDRVSNHRFVEIVDNVAKFGFELSAKYPTSLSLLKEVDMTPIESAYNEFHIELDDMNEYNDLGFYDPESYSLDYTKAFSKAADKIKESIYDIVPHDSMWYELTHSGSRGGKANLVQIYASKGRIAKSASESFDVAIEKGLVSSFTSMEHFLAAHGARKDIISKSIKTADTGYMARKLRHVISDLFIKSADCGTSDGIEIDVASIRRFIPHDPVKQEEVQKATESAKAIFKEFVTGRYTAGEVSRKITKELANTLAENDKPIKIRSPLTCSDPCCAMCYGTNPDTRKDPIIGAPVGIHAAHSLGETITQLTMKLFQRGGVADAGGSAYDRIEAIFDIVDIRKKASEGNYFTYSPVAWADGKLLQDSLGKGMVKLRIEGSKDSRVVPDTLTYKVGEMVKKGDILSRTHCDVYPPESIQFAGVERTIKRMLYDTYIVYSGETPILPIHFEMLFTMLIRYTPIKVNHDDLRYGMWYNRLQLDRYRYNYKLLKGEFEPSFDGVSKVCYTSSDFLDAIMMERIKETIIKAVLNKIPDPMDTLASRIAFGKKIRQGTGYNPNYIEEVMR